MPRPLTHADLPADVLRGTQVATFELPRFPVNGKLIQALGAFITATEAAKLTSAEQYGTTTIYRPPTLAELDSALDAAQGAWDTNRRNYEAALVSGTEPEDYTRYGISTWCAAEGVPLPWETTSV